MLKRLPDIVDNIMETRKRSKHIRSTGGKGQELIGISIKDYPHFAWYIRDLYEEEVEAAAQQCLEKCRDELQATRLIYWEAEAKK